MFKKDKVKDYMTVSEAADHLGVSASTLRNWDRSGKLTAARNPLNRYRLYRREDLNKILEEIESNPKD